MAFFNALLGNTNAAPADAPSEAPAEAPAAEVWPQKLDYLLEVEWVFNELKEKPVKQL